MLLNLMHLQPFIFLMSLFKNLNEYTTVVIFNVLCGKGPYLSSIAKNAKVKIVSKNM